MSQETMNDGEETTPALHQKKASKVDDSHSVSPPLDGGLQAWSVVAGSFLCLFVSFGWVNCIGLFQTYYETNQLKGYSASTIAWITSFEVFIMFLGGPILGKICDVHGPRYPLFIGTSMHVFGLMMTSLCKEYYQFLLAQGICSSIGASCIFYAALGATSTWFSRKAGLAIGIVASGSSLGGVVFPIMINKLLPEIGFAWTMRTSAFIILGLLAVANVTVRTRLPPNPKPGSPKDLVMPFTEPLFCLTAMGAFLFSFGLFPPINYVISEAIYRGMGYDLALYMLPILNGASLFGRIIPGALGDKVGRYNCMVIMTGLTAVVVLAIWIPVTTNAGIILFAAAFGLTSGAFISLAPALITQISDVSKVGVRIGAMYAVTSVANLTSNPIGGGLISAWDGRYTGLMVFCGVVEAAGMLFFLAARIYQTGFRVAVVV
ncbi:hypothetical protein Asppvi_011411 [Aspergillus pseudoviridinutans]|uniref:Major facilitator superfamily (MFS) profile domain-containing protein n=1 Tax=Aspergillus pseudoviridinutans TaxID=1517512 RepID=A0A9P3BR34_9EURO|nr:uncharacterized protein Asppvi_011411 [Aspergillus pseudoviridinutans]GIJ92429.1 hypothetical protein Asppvi_011411 [Aspergillus pseudoviridinutans]